MYGLGLRKGLGLRLGNTHGLGLEMLFFYVSGKHFILADSMFVVLQKSQSFSGFNQDSS